MSTTQVLPPITAASPSLTRVYTRNNRLLTTLPTPVISLASAQLTGRGRGSNVWLSPPGCLQFSVLVRLPLAHFPAPKIVFVQYLFALAVAEACRAPGVLGNGNEGEMVRIKWPNDIYAVTSDGEKKKIGGILVNTSFGAGNIELVIGTLTQPPPLANAIDVLALTSAHRHRMWSECAQPAADHVARPARR